MESAKYDYLKWFLIGTPDLASGRYRLLRQELGIGNDLPTGNPKITTLGFSPVGNFQRFSIECWGSLLDNAEQLSILHFGTFQRVDVKMPIPGLSVQDTDNLAKRWKHFDKRRNVQTFHSRFRSKRNGRSAGGEGVALGSHKSDVRISVYRRHGQDFHLEVQLSGTRLTRIYSMVLNRHKNKPIDTRELWNELKEDILGFGIDVALKSAGLKSGVFPDHIPEI